jgi:hypothetical protein
VLDCLLTAAAPVALGQPGYKDWVFINYTFKRFEGLSHRSAIAADFSPNSDESQPGVFYQI